MAKRTILEEFADHQPRQGRKSIAQGVSPGYFARQTPSPVEFENLSRIPQKTWVFMRETRLFWVDWQKILKLVGAKDGPLRDVSSAPAGLDVKLPRIPTACTVGYLLASLRD